ncbi:unnamed protein product [Sphacelaria rigidula]
MKCNACTLYHDMRNGSSGVRITADPGKMGEVAMEQKAHLHRLPFISKAAIRAKVNQGSLKFVSLQADAAAQTVFALPMCSPVTHVTDKGYAERQKIMAVFVEGQFVDFFLAPQTVGGGSNLICTSIHRAVARLFDTHCSDGTLASSTNCTPNWTTAWGKTRVISS